MFGFKKSNTGRHTMGPNLNNKLVLDPGAEQVKMLYQELKDDVEQFDHFIGPDDTRVACCTNQTDDG